MLSFLFFLIRCMHVTADQSSSFHSSHSTLFVISLYKASISQTTKRKTHSQPGVLALGYVNTTTPAPLFSSNSANVTLSPSCVWTVPPKEVRSAMVSPSAVSFALAAAGFAGAAGGAEDVSVANGELSVGLPATVAFALSASFLMFSLWCEVR